MVRDITRTAAGDRIRYTPPPEEEPVEPTRSSEPFGPGSSSIPVINRSIEGEIRRQLRESTSGQDLFAIQKSRSISPVDARAGKASHHLALATQANQKIHAGVFNPANGSLLCHNVRYMDIDLLDEQQRTMSAEVELAQLRNMNIFRDVPTVSQHIATMKAQVCDTLAHLAEDEVRARDPAVHTARLMFKPSHAVLMIGELAAEMLGTPMEEWPADIVICDPWSGNDGKGQGGIVCLARDYQKDFRRTFEKMGEERGIEVLTDRHRSNGKSPEGQKMQDWVGDSDGEDWHKFLYLPSTAPKLMLERVETAAGRIDYVEVEPEVTSFLTTDSALSAPTPQVASQDRKPEA